ISKRSSTLTLTTSSSYHTMLCIYILTPKLILQTCSTPKHNYQQCNKRKTRVLVSKKLSPCPPLGLERNRRREGKKRKEKKSTITLFPRHPSGCRAKLINLFIGCQSRHYHLCSIPPGR